MYICKHRNAGLDFAFSFCGVLSRVPFAKRPLGGSRDPDGSSWNAAVFLWVLVLLL